MTAIKWLVILVISIVSVGLLAFGPRAMNRSPKIAL